MSVTMLATHNVSPDSVECWSIPRHSQYSDYIITRSVLLLNDSLSQSLLVRDDQSYYRSILAIARRQAYRVYIIYI